MSINIGNSEVLNIYIGDTPATAVYIGDTQIWGGGGKDYSTEYFTLSALESGDFYWNTSNIEYSVNDGAWTTWTATDSANTLSVNSGDEIRLKTTGSYPVKYKDQTICSTGTFDAEGNIMSLQYGDNFSDKTSEAKMQMYYKLFEGSKIVNAKNLILPSAQVYLQAYSYMFNNCTLLISAPVLPATNFTGNQPYTFMFQGCTSLTTAPALPATNLSKSTYARMFQGCTSLVNPPVLPATTLANNCYQGMFAGCTSLTSAPELPATTAVNACYDQMFYGCTSLAYVKCLATDISASDCTRWWLGQVSATGTFVKDANMNDWTTGDSGIPDGWTVENA